MTDHRAIAATLEEAEMRSVEISKTLREMLPNGWNFTLVLARPEKPGQDGIMTYISDLERDGSVEILRELTGYMAEGEPTL